MMSERKKLMITLWKRISGLFLAAGLTILWVTPAYGLTGSVRSSTVMLQDSTGILAFIVGPSINNRAASSNIYLGNVASGQQTPITANQTDAIYGSLSWSPDGKRLAFSLWADRRKTYGNFGHFNIYTLDLATAATKRLTDGESDWLPTWSPDGTKIAFVSIRNNHYGIYLMAADGSNPETLTTADLPGFYQWLAWSPDGNTIAFILDDDATCPHIFTMHSDGADIRQLTHDPECDGTSLAWSPDSQQIAFTRQDGQISILTLSNGEIRQLMPNKAAFCGSLSWSPDGKALVFTLIDDVNSVAIPKEAIYATDTSGTYIRQLMPSSENMHITSLMWQPVQREDLAVPKP
jgi:Tol biopolymer transport system component